MTECKDCIHFFEVCAYASHQIPICDSYAEKERHGRWIEPTRLYYGAKQYECSICCSDTFWKKHSITEKYPCCPNCGADMDLEEQ